MSRLIVHHDVVFLREPTPELTRKIAEYLTFPDPNAHFSGGPSTFTKYNHLQESFPTGFFEMIRRELALAGFEFTVDDLRKFPDEEPSADLSWLRDYQTAAVDKVLKMKRGILWMPTGAGKTEVAAALAMRIKGPWLFVAHRAGLMDQAADRFELRSGEKAWRIGGGYNKVTNTSVKFNSVTFDTLRLMVSAVGDLTSYHMEELFADFSGVIIDECHVLPASSFLATIKAACETTPYRVGLSGTPLQRGDGRTINAIGALGPVIYRIKPEVLIDAGVLSKPTIHMLQFSATPSRQSTWAKVYDAVVVKDTLRNQLVVRAI
jgi:superfamily II DNA or RNA helicase